MRRPVNQAGPVGNEFHARQRAGREYAKDRMPMPEVAGAAFACSLPGLCCIKDIMVAEDSFIDFKCPYCGEVASFPLDHAGLAQECPNCTESVIVPADGSGVGRALPIPIRTARLSLRRLSGLDWKDLAEVLADENLFAFLEGRPLGEEEITHWLEMDSQIKLTTPDQAFCLGLESLDSHKVIGYLSLKFSDATRLQTVLTVLLNRQFQRQGFATEAVKGALDFCFHGLGLHRVTAYCDRRNVAACRLGEKTAMRQEGVFLQDRFVNGEWVDTVCHAVLREEFH